MNRNVNAAFRWLALVLPRPVPLAAVVLCVWTPLAFWMVIAPSPVDTVSFVLIPCGVLSLAVFYGLHRGLHFHPILHKEYQSWLAATPWHYPQPLPFGPAGLGMQDAVFAGLLGLLMFPVGWIHRADGWPKVFEMGTKYSLETIGIFLAAWMLVVLALLPRVKQAGPLYSVLFLLGGTVGLRYQPWLAAIGFLASCAAANLGVRRSLQTLPAADDRPAGDLFGLVDAKSKQLGYPWDAGRPGQMAPKLSWRDAVLAPCLAGAWFFCLFGPETTFLERGEVWPFRLAFVAAMIAVRLVTYCKDYWPPISLGGRLATKQYYLPGYDQVFTAPLLACAVGLVGDPMLSYLNLSPALSNACLLTVQCLCLTCCPPTYSAWVLTGQHRVMSWPSEKLIR